MGGGGWGGGGVDRKWHLKVLLVHKGGV
jgi:hypothetical protein